MKTKIFFTISLLGILALCALIAMPALTQDTRYRLRSTDILTINVFGHKDLTTKTRVTTGGYITFPLLGKVYAKNLTVLELEEKLNTLLEKDYLVSAPVTIFIEEYNPRQVSVLGEVNVPGKFEMPKERDMTLLDAIAMAGGFTKDALLTRVKVTRTKEGGGKESIIINVKDIIKRDQDEKNIVLEPDDIVIVPESFF